MPRKTTLQRYQLAKFLPDHESIKHFEDLSFDVNEIIPENIESIELFLSILQSRIEEFISVAYSEINALKLAAIKQNSIEDIIKINNVDKIDELILINCDNKNIFNKIDELELINSLNSNRIYELLARIDLINQSNMQYDYPIVDYGGYKFDGSTNYLDGNALTDIVASKFGSFAIRLRFTNASTTTELLFATNNNYIQISRSSTGNIQVTGKNAAGTSILNIITTGTPVSAAGEYDIFISFNLNTTGTARIVIVNISNGVITTGTTETTYTNDSIGYATPTEYSIGSSSSGSTYFNGEMYRFWFDATVNLDFNEESIRRKFITKNKNLVFLGIKGEIPTGMQPILFLGNNLYKIWHFNRGSGISTLFTEHGTPAAPINPVYGQYYPYINGESVRIFIGTGAVRVGISDDSVGLNKAVGAATVVNLPPAIGSGKRYTITDVKGDANANNITLTPPSGTINGAATFIMNVNYQSITIQDMAANVYMVI